jgi:hypothetical protein
VYLERSPVKAMGPQKGWGTTDSMERLMHGQYVEVDAERPDGGAPGQIRESLPPMRAPASRCVAVCVSVVLAACASSGTMPSPAYQYPEHLVPADALRLLPQVRSAPPFPDSERRTGRGANFIAIFVIDSAGRVERNSVVFTGDATPPFRKEVCGWLSQQLFQRPEREAPGVRSVSVMPFKYELSGTASWNEEKMLPDAIKQSLFEKGLARTVAELPSPQRCS